MWASRFVASAAATRWICEIHRRAPPGNRISFGFVSDADAIIGRPTRRNPAPPPRHPQPRPSRRPNKPSRQALMNTSPDLDDEDDEVLEDEEFDEDAESNEDDEDLDPEEDEDEETW